MNVYCVIRGHIQQKEHHNVRIVIHRVEGTVIQQMANVKVALLDMDSQVGHVQFVQVEHIQHQELHQLVNHVHQFVTRQDVFQQQESVMDVMLDTDSQMEIVLHVEA